MNVVETILIENIDKPASLFVFPTDVAVSRWADRLLHVHGGTIAMEKFIAWDTFKQNAVRSKVQNRKSIPSVLRKMFIGTLIQENAALCAGGGIPVFTSLIRKEWAGQADLFAPWLTGILPQLGIWFKQAAGMPLTLENIAVWTPNALLGDDGDLCTLACRYGQFLEQRGLFEPAWETPPFEDTGKECFIFFSESLSDFDEYRDLLAASEHVKTINAPAEQQAADVFFYTNARSEITEAALYILALHTRRNIAWDAISVSIPNEGSYGPYLLREFANRNIPCVQQSGKPLASYPAGQFFTALATCDSSGFAFSSLTALLLNPHLPWKNSNDIQALIDFGIKNNCINSWTEIGEEGGSPVPVNVWEDAFARPFGGYAPQVRALFMDLKRQVHALCHAASFADIRKRYFVFRECFFDMENCLEETDLILSRCISELMYLIEIEKSFPGVQVPSPYGFFTEYLGEVNYLAQQRNSGVAILPYRTSAPAPFDCHIVLGASQSSLSTVFAPLAFLTKSRREKIGITEHDASLAFIALHRFNSRLPAAFFCSEQTFSGYTIPHSALDADSKPRQRYSDDPLFGDKFAADLYRLESVCLRHIHTPPPRGGGGRGFLKLPVLSVVPELHRLQKQGFEAWRLRRERPAEAESAGRSLLDGADHPLRVLLRQRFCGNEQYKGQYGVSASLLTPYFECPLSMIFMKALNLENVTIETGLMADNITGQVYHAVLNLFLDELKKTGEAITAPFSGGGKKPSYTLSVPYTGLLERNIAAVFESFPSLPGSGRQEMSMLTARLLRAQRPVFFSVLEHFLGEFTARFADCRVVSSEEMYFLSRGVYFLTGRIDCILTDRNDRLFIVDFKTKNIPKLSQETPDDELADFQLPMYIRLAEHAFDRVAHNALFMSIVDTKVSQIDEKSINEIICTFDRKTDQFAQEISGGSFSFAPFRPDQCRNCRYSGVCRALYRVFQGKNNGIRKKESNSQ